MAAPTTIHIRDLRSIIWSCPIIDNHAHNLLRSLPLRQHDLRTIVTEANGSAIAQTTSGLPLLRAVKQLRKLYKTSSDADWEAVKAERLRLLDDDADDLIKRCLDGTQTILIDDGLGQPDELEAYHWHSRYTASPCKRIVRIETVAAEIFSGMYHNGQLPIGVAIASIDECTLAWESFNQAFETNISECLNDPEVVGFKSVICYRSGLDIEPDIHKTAILSAFKNQFLPTCKSNAFRINHKGMTDALVLATAKLVAAHYRELGRTKPIQFHTGLGDNDISLLKSNPACMQTFIEAYPTVPIVLLHSAYPYTQEAGYLATVYSNVYLDIGEVFPMISRDGQEKVLQQALELTPTTKLLWSTDGHYFPETYYLANHQGRQALERVFEDYVDHDDMSVVEAAQAVCDILYNNSNHLYFLNLQQQVPAAILQSRNAAEQQLPLHATQSPDHLGPSKPLVSNTGRSMTPGPSNQNLVTLDTSIELYFVQWVDYLGQIRARCIPSKEFLRLAIAGELRFSISYGNLGTLQNDGTTPVVHPVGQLYVHPDLTSLKPMTRQGKMREHAATVMSSFYTEDQKPHSMCPRRTLSSLVSKLKHDWQMAMRVGFEIECVFYRPGEPNKPITTNHAWSTFTPEQYLDGYPLMIKIQKGLQETGIHIQQMHAEAGPGQYEFVLPPAHPITAIDALYQARQCIQQITASEGLRVTFHASPFSGVGNASHVHMSFSSAVATETLESKQMCFMAGVLKHLSALCAFTMPEQSSYDRVKENAWTNGVWIAWGTQNREVPLRRIANQDGSSQRWEFRCIDGMPNAYLALSAILSAGLCGLEDELSMSSHDVTDNPSRLSSNERQSLGIVEKLPASLSGSLAALSNDRRLRQALPSIIPHYEAMKHAEQEMLQGMDEEEQRRWLIERY